MLRLLSILLVTVVVLTSCNGDNPTDEPSPEPNALLDEAVENITATNTFRMLLEQRGASYPFLISLDETGGTVQAALRRAEAQYVAPDAFYANVILNVSGVPFTIDIFARNENQWLRLPPAPWLNIPFAPGFNPMHLISAGSGFEAALATLLELQYIGIESLEDGTSTFHLRGVASGPSVSDLLVGLLQTANDVLVDVYIERATRLPALIIVTQPETATEEEPEPTTWRVEVYDFDDAADIDDPEG